MKNKFFLIIVSIFIIVGILFGYKKLIYKTSFQLNSSSVKSITIANYDKGIKVIQSDEYKEKILNLLNNIKLVEPTDDICECIPHIEMKITSELKVEMITFRCNKVITYSSKYTSNDVKNINNDIEETFVIYRTNKNIINDLEQIYKQIN